MFTNDSRFDDENIKQAIQQLIIDEEDPKEKLRLLMLLQLNTSLISNVVAVRNLTTEFKEHRTEFDSHVKAEEKMLNTGRGAIWSVIALIGFVQAVSGYVFTTHMDRFDKVATISVEVHEDIEIHKERLKNLDDKFGRLMDQLSRTSK